MLLRPCTLLVILAALLPLPGAFGQTARNQQNAPHAAPLSGSVAMPMMKMPLVVPLFVQDHDFSSSLVMVNDSTLFTYADVVLTGLNGGKITAQRVQFPPHAQRRVEINDLLVAVASPATTGRITIMQSPDLKGMPIAAQLSITYRGAREPNFIDEEVAMPSAEGSQTLRAAADAGDGSPLIAISSLAESGQHILVECLNGDSARFSKRVDLLAGETLVTEACSDRTVHGDDFATVRESSREKPFGPVGIALTSDAMPGSFAAFGLAPHRKHDDKYFSAVTFADPKMLNSPNTVFTGVPVGRSALLPGGRYVPELALANFSTKAIHVRVKYAQTSGSAATAQDVANVTLGPGAIRGISLDNLAGDPELRNSFVVLSDGAPGDLMTKLISKSESASSEVELLGKDEKDPQNGGNHPWSLEQETDSTLLLFNHGPVEEGFAVVISSGGDTIWQKAYPLASMQTQAISFRTLIHDQVKDDHGQTLPPHVLSGQVSWYSVGSGKGRILQSNRDAAMARSFSCGAKLIVCGASFTAGTTTIPVGSTVAFGSIGTLMCDASVTPPGTCTGDGASGTCFTSQCTYSWTSASPSIAGISGAANADAVSVTGFAPGTTNINGNVLDRASACQYVPHGTATVTPTVTIQGNPTYVYVGQDPTIVQINALFGQGNPSGGTYKWSSPDASISFDNPAAQDVHVKATSFTGRTNDTKLALDYTQGGQSAPQASVMVTKRIFKFLAGDSVIKLTTYNGPTKYGYLFNASYNVFANPGGKQVTNGSGVSTSENVTQVSSNVPITPTTGAAALTANSQVLDTLSLTSNSPLPANLSIVDTQTWSVGSIYVRTNTVTWTASSVSVTNQGPYN